MLVKVQALADLADLPLGAVAYVDDTKRVRGMIRGGLLREVVAGAEGAEPPPPFQESLLPAEEAPEGVLLVDEPAPEDDDG